MHYPPALKHQLDFLGAGADFIATFLFVRVSLWAWPISLIAIVINTSLYLLTGLYADTLLQGVYFISCLYGWYYWRWGGHKHHASQVRSIRASHGAVLCVVGGVIFSVLSWGLLPRWHSQVPYWDAGTTVLSLLAQWLTCRKLLEAWVLWFLVDLMYVGLYTYKGIPAHALTDAVYLIFAVMGWRRWRASCQSHHPRQGADILD